MFCKVVPVRTTKAYAELQVSLPSFLSSALSGFEGLASHFGCFAPRKIPPGTHSRGALVGPRVGLDALGVEKNPLPLPGIA